MASFLLVPALLGIMLLGAGCVTKLPTQEGGPVASADPRDSGVGFNGTYTEANLRPLAEQRLQAFIAALDQRNSSAARTLLSSQQRDPEFLSMMTHEQMRTVADWYRTYQFAAIWGDRVEFRPSRVVPDVAANSLYVHFAPGEEGIMY